MNRNFTTGILIVTFSLSSVNLSLATQVVAVPPIIVQPYDIREINEQTMEQDHVNHEQELAIKTLIDDNQQLSNTSSPQNAALEAVFRAEQARIQKASRYYDLIRLTEDVDDSKGIADTMGLKKDVMEEKYNILTELKNEMQILNDKLKSQSDYQSIKENNAQQMDRIQGLIQQLSDVNQKIQGYDEQLALKDQQIAQLKNSLTQAQDESSAKDMVIAEEKNQITALQSNPKAVLTTMASVPATPASSSLSLGLAPIIVNLTQQGNGVLPSSNSNVALSPIVVNPVPKGGNVALPPIIVNAPDQRDAIIKEKNEVIRHLNQALMHLNNSVAIPPIIVNSAIEDKDGIIKQKDATIHWLSEVLAAVKNKAEYYRLTSQKERIAMEDMQGQVQQIKNDFAERFKDYDQIETSVFALKDQVGQLDIRLSRKQSEVDFLKSELENKDAENKTQNTVALAAQEDLKNQIQDKENQISQMTASIQSMQQDAATKETAAQRDDRIKLAKELIGLQQEEASLLQEKDGLEQSGNALLDRHVLAFENRIKQYLVNHQAEAADLQSRLQELKDEMDQKQQEVDSLTAELKDKIAQEKSQGVLSVQIQDLQGQLQEKQDQIASMKNDLQAGQDSYALKQQLAEAQSSVEQLQQQLTAKTTDAQKINAIVQEYQQKLEAKNSAYNEQLRRLSVLGMRLQQKNAQIAFLQKNMSDLQQQASGQDQEAQAKDLALSMVQQKAMDDKLNALKTINGKQIQEINDLKSQLALTRQELQGMPSSDEVDFLRTGLNKATAELKQKDAMLLTIKANADEYASQFKAQSRDFESLKQQFQDAQEQIQHKDEDFKYKQMELIRFKEQAAIKEGALQDQINALTHKTKMPRTSFTHRIFVSGKNDAEKIQMLEEQLRGAQKQIDELETELNQFQRGSAGAKMKQAMDKINSQGRVINALVQKLQDHGQTVDLSAIQ